MGRSSEWATSTIYDLHSILDRAIPGLASPADLDLDSRLTWSRLEVARRRRSHARPKGTELDIYRRHQTSNMIMAKSGYDVSRCPFISCLRNC